MRLIDADKLKRKCQKVATEAWKMKIKASAEVIMNQFIDFIDEADAVDAVPVVHGRWSGDFCSKCGISKYNFIRILHDDDGPFGTWNFCPHCGADMREDGDNGQI